MTNHKWRRSDFISLAGVALIGGWIWAASEKNSKLEQVVKVVEDPSMGMTALDKRLTVLEEAEKDHKMLLYAIARAVGARTEPAINAER